MMPLKVQLFKCPFFNLSLIQKKILKDVKLSVFYIFTIESFHYVLFFFQNYRISKLQQHLKSIENAATVESLKYMLDEFIEYLLKYPEIRNKGAKVSFLTIIFFPSIILPILLKTSFSCQHFKFINCQKVNAPTQINFLVRFL